MSFFEPPPPPPEPPQVAREPWMGPPVNVVGGAVALSVVLARGSDAAVVVEGGRAYPTGFQFTLSLRWRSETGDERYRDAQLEFHRWHGGELPPELLRFGVQFADGRRATNLRQFGMGRPDEGPVLTQHGGRGQASRVDLDWWLWPLPPEGPLAFVCEWPAYGIAETRYEVDSAGVREAAQRAETLWPDGDDNGPGQTQVFARK